MAAFMLVTGKLIPWWHMLLWNAAFSIVGVLVAFPLKRRFFNEEQSPFPEGRASGVVLDTLYQGHADAGMIRAKVLAYTAAGAGFLQFLMSDGLQRPRQFKPLRLGKLFGLAEPWHLRERFDDYDYVFAAKVYTLIPKILGTDIRQLGLRLSLDAAMPGVGGLMGIRASSSVRVRHLRQLRHPRSVDDPARRHCPRLNAAGAAIPLNRGEIVNQWLVPPVGRHHDARRFPRDPRRQTRTLHQRLENGFQETHCPGRRRSQAR